MFDLPYACIGEKSDGHTMYNFVLNPKFHWSIGDSHVHRKSCAQNAADDEGLQ